VSTYLTRPAEPEAVEARQWTAGTSLDELAEWCGGWTYTGPAHMPEHRGPGRQPEGAR
jgi:hypothetical protein